MAAGRSRHRPGADSSLELPQTGQGSGRQSTHLPPNRGHREVTSSKAEGAGSPLQVEVVKDRVNDTAHALDIHKADHRAGASSHLAPRRSTVRSRWWCAAWATDTWETCRTITARANRFPVVAPSARAASAPGKGGKRPRPVRGSRLDIHKQAYITHRDPSLTPKSSWHMVSRKDKVEIGNSV